ncbi:MAG: poly-A polymerase, partial [Actinomycetota bacterium]|nr:poly-A polymerase [Actinomycetota bacterium]
MDVPSPPELLRRLRALPAGQQLLDLLGEDPRVHLVGGAVRDLLLGREPYELDLLVEGDAAAVARRLGASPRIHPRFGTATVALHDVIVDLAGSRRERYPHPGALPEVEPAPLREDLRRRDFTVNAVALVLGGERAGEVVAVPHELRDLGAGVLRLMHVRSFLDDPTRLLRL